MNKKFISLVLCALMIVNCFAFTAFAQRAQEDISLNADDALTLINRMNDYLEPQVKSDRSKIFHLVQGYMATDAGVEYMIGLVDDQSDVGTNQLILGYINSFGVTASDKTILKNFLRFVKCIPAADRVSAFEKLDNRDAYNEELSDREQRAIDNVYATLIDSDFAQILDNDHNLSEMVIFNFLITLGKNIVVTDSSVDTNDFELYEVNEEFASKLEEEFAGSKINGKECSNANEILSAVLESVNSSSKFTNAVNADSKLALGRDDIKIYIKKEVETTGISTDSPALATNLSPITFTANFGDDVDEDTISWYVNGVKQDANGNTFTFTPPEYGTYNIYATYENDAGNIVQSNSVTLSRPEAVVVVTPTPTSTSSGRSGRSGGGGTSVTTATPTPTPAQKDELGPIPAPEPAQKVTFVDAKDHWARDYLEALADKKIMTGYGDGTVSPDIGVTREEMAVLLTRILGLSEVMSTGMQTPYTDHADIQSYARQAVYVLSERNIYLGYDDGSFKPQNVLTREEIMSLFDRIIADIDVEELTFTDKDDISGWAYNSVAQLYTYGIVNGYPDGRIIPQADVTRAEAAVMIYKLLYRMGNL